MTARFDPHIHTRYTQDLDSHFLLSNNKIIAVGWEAAYSKVNNLNWIAYRFEINMQFKLFWVETHNWASLWWFEKRNKREHYYWQWNVIHTFWVRSKLHCSLHFCFNGSIKCIIIFFLFKPNTYKIIVQSLLFFY